MPNINLAPYDPRQQAIDRRRALAQALQQQAYTPIEAPPVAGANISPLQGIAKIVQAIAGQYQNRKLDKQQAALNQEIQTGREAQAEAFVRQLGLPTAEGGTDETRIKALAKGLASPDQQTAQQHQLMLTNILQQQRQAQQDAAEQARLQMQLTETTRHNQAMEAQKSSAEEGTLRARGLKRDEAGNIVPLTRDEMGPAELAALEDKEALKAYRDSQKALADATTELRKVQADTNSEQYQMAARRLAIAQQNADTARERLGISQGNLDVRESQFNVNTFGGYGKSEALLSSVSELADKINTSQGVMAKAKGTAREAAAKLNLDDDVAEYDSLVKAFTPIWARALGHTGVLTQQDVDSARAALPAPGDSKSLKDRKMSRIQKILNAQIQATETAAGRPRPTATPTAMPIAPAASGGWSVKVKK